MPLRTPALLLIALLASCGDSTVDQVDTLAYANSPARPECIAPSRPGGGFDLTCKLAQSGFLVTGILDAPMRVSYQPGGIGAVAYNTIIAQRPSDPNVIVAFSGGSLLNLAEGKFGRYTEDDVRWVAAVGRDYGTIAVRADSPYRTLDGLVDALKADPTSVVFGAGGTVGSQDWMKSALVADAAGIDYRAMRYVSFEGGGEAQTALLGGHIQAYSGDISEVLGLLDAGRLRVLAVLSEERLAAPYAEVPTAREQGYDVEWPILRGYYVGPHVSESAYRWWVESFDAMMSEPQFDELRQEIGMFPYAKTGAELDAVIRSRMDVYRDYAARFDLLPEPE